MIQEMKLLEVPFEKIKSGEKTIEIRLHDEKRKALRVGDIIEFSKLPIQHEKLSVKVVGLFPFESFEKLVDNFDMSDFGYSETEMSKKEFVNYIYEIYTKEDENTYGVLGIKIEKLDN